MSILRREPDLLRVPRPTGDAEGDSVLCHLGRLLQSKRDYASFLPQFGLGETFHRPVTQVTLDLLRREILAQITLYEPRLQAPEVVTLPRAADGALRFRLSGRLPDGRPLQLVVELAPSRAHIMLAESGERR